ncbi:MAG: hypothetical protein QG608_3539 [Actinomycetota bacterium]|nr:hypothetical protein [Actinomycetota bacterium]
MISAVVLGSGLWGLDRVLAHRIEQRIEQRISCLSALRSQTGAGRISADVGRGPVIPDLLVGELDRVHLQGEDLFADGVAVSLDADLTGVRSTGSAGSSRLSTTGGAATLTVPLTALAERLSRTGEGARAGRAAVLSRHGDSLAVSGQGLLGAVTVLVDLRLRDGTLVFSPASVLVAGQQLPARTARDLLGGDERTGAGRLLQERTFDLPDLPDGSRWEAVGLTQTGLELRVALDAGPLPIGSGDGRNLCT